ncbi:MAG: hypothetical protein JST_000138 [Candidatus Parcubacteria bacterium]|jgi:hypothetical protein|nr:MAG: hypothetical protein JST_1210 [Candidatus Parcubacteria bacterium]
MKLESSFNDFLENTVNLNGTRYQIAKSGIETMKSILQNDEIFGDKFISIKPQGSFRQETIIKPVRCGTDFDVDILFEVKATAGWESKDYLNKLSSQFKKLDRYKDKVDTRGKSRCVTIDYENDFHIDIVPAINISNQSLVMNKTENKFELTDGDGYAEWFYRQDSITGKKYLKKIVRLLKYIRDFKQEFDIKSVALTTFVGNQVLSSDNLVDQYPDLSTSFVLLLSRLDLYLQSNAVMPIIVNPVLPSENFNRHLKQDDYLKFRDAIHKYSQIALDAYNDVDEHRSLSKWQKIFGDSFTVKENRNLSVSINGLHLANFSHKQELADLNIPIIDTFASVEIRAGLYWGKGDYKIVNRRFKGSFSTKNELPRFHWLKYTAITNYNKPYDVYWQVVNTGASAQSQGAKGLRGEIKLGSNEQWERSLYTGVHWVECFIVDIATNACVCRSGPFYVGFQERVGDVSD